MTTTPRPSSQPPARLASKTNLSKAEAQWRASVMAVQDMSVHLDISTAPIKEQPSFTVRTRAKITVREDAAGLWMDFLGEGISALTVDSEEHEANWDGARLALPTLAAGEHTIEVTARGRYSNSGQGLHRFHDPVDGATYLYTHFEPSDARRAWVCFDQPDLKSPWSMEIRHPQGWTVLANGILAGTTEPDAEGQVRSTFATTLPLPSYLTATAAGPWHRVTGEWRSRLRPDDAPVPISWSCRASLAQHLDAEELLEVTRSGMDLFDEVYAYPYPWGSYDSVLVPEYNLGAMENPGCVTFNEEVYLFQGPATAAQHGGRANTILHEMSHMWFGDLVTPRWWEDTWLKESFADHQGTWAQAKATPWTDAWTTFALGRKSWAYAEDSRPATTHPIVATVEDVEAARQTFDGITYAKGASVLKQLVAYVGEETFFRAAQTWFREHAFDNGELSQFIDTLSRASGRDMSAWDEAWLRSSGPSILSNEIEWDEQGVTRLTIHQSGTNLSTGEPILRPHQILVGFYAFDEAGALSRTQQFPVTLTGQSVEVPEAVGAAVPDLVTINDEDLTYAVLRPDPASLAVARTSLRLIEDSLTQAVWWSTLDNLTRDGLLRVPDFIGTVLSQATDATQAATLANLLAKSLHYALAYTAPEQCAPALAPLINAWELLQSAPAGSDAQLIRARAWVDAAGHARLISEEAASSAATRLRQILGGELADLELTSDLKWRVLIALARLGELTEAELEAQRQADPSASGAVRALQAASSRPEAGTKQAVFERAFTDTALSNDELDALIAAFNVASHRELTADYTERYLASLEAAWAGRGQEIATRLVNGFFPTYGESQDLDVVRSWMAEHADAPAALLRLLAKGEDDLARAIRAR